MNNPVLQDLRGETSDDEPDDRSEDKWDFFR